MATLQVALGRIDKQDLGGKVATTLAEVDVNLGKLDRVLEAFSGKNGLLASAQRAADSFGEVGRAGQGTQKELETTLRDVSEAAEAVRALVNAIERDPDMLLKGKSKTRIAR